ncbi:hypothetical protein LNK82_12295 [Saccharothrix sp. NEAU-S10]|nr:hypothetical protein [Saccharothrix luteola]MCC8245072.1 hypothetical protein [Saccharothrix luteola]
MRRVVAGQNQLQGRFVGLVVDRDRQLGQGEQPVQQFGRGPVQIHLQVRQRLDQLDAVDAGVLRLLLSGLLQRVEGGQQCPAFGLQVVVAPAQAVGERVARVAVLGLAQDVVLLAHRVREVLLEPLPLLFRLPAGAVVDRGEVGEEEFASLWAEHPFGVQAVDRCDEQVFAHVDGGWVVGVLVGATPVVVGGVAAVVGGVVAGVADHAASAVAQHPAAEQVGSGGPGVLPLSGTVT